MHVIFVYFHLSVGGFDGHQFLNTVECYSDVTEVWTSLPNMKCRRSKHFGISSTKKGLAEIILLTFETNLALVVLILISIIDCIT